MKIAWLIALAAGCSSFPTPSDQFRCTATDECDPGRVCESGFCVVPGVDVDGGLDAAGFDCTSWSPAPAHFTPCEIAAPKGPLALDAPGVHVFNTDTASLTDPSGASSSVANTTVSAGLVISVERVAVGAGATLRVIGSKPLIIASWADLDVNGTIDASSETASATSRIGAGGGACTAQANMIGQSNGDGAGGGGGGAFQGAGGIGGIGNGNNNGRPGAPGAIVARPALAGGCAGGDGGEGVAANTRGRGGAGGGAIQLSARQAISITGRVLAGGAGGTGGTNHNGGGGGGGAGGMIGLEAASLTVGSGAILAANGGGGGEGGCTDNGGQVPAGSGTAGAASATPAPGGLGRGDSGDGGTGSANTTLGGAQGQNNNTFSGGGGGGGAGYIVFKSGAAPVTTGAVISPAATTL